jgi:winged helix DNA-binding protein
MPTRRRITVEERRARLARRHAVAPAHRAGGVVEAARRVVCLHATDPATTFLSAWARVDGFAAGDLERALHADRTLVKHLAMRRTLFVFPRERLADAQAGASARVAVQERKRLIRFVEQGGLHRRGARWLDTVSAEVRAALASGRELTYAELKREIPRLDGSIAYGEGKTWGGSLPVGPRVLTALSAAGEVVRATNAGRWTTSRPRWASMTSWLGSPLETRTEAVAVAALVAAWLRAFGPGTELDLQWWLGSTLTAVRRALSDVHAVAVDLEGTDRAGYVLPDDVDEAAPVDRWIALLPPLDPTTMGWVERGWYLGPHKAEIFDRSGNAGPTIWCDGRIVGGWCQRSDGGVEIQLLERVGRDARKAIDAEARRLSAWLNGARPLPRFPSPLSRQMAGRTP